jgi:uncharacterized protein (TIGR03000 family)
MYGMILMAALGGGTVPAGCGPIYGGGWGTPMVVSGGCFGAGCNGGCYGGGCWGSPGAGCWGSPGGGCWGSMPLTSGCFGSGWTPVVNLGCYGSSLGGFAPSYANVPSGVHVVSDNREVVIREPGGEVLQAGSALTEDSGQARPAVPARVSPEKVRRPAPAASDVKEATESIGPPEESLGPARATLVVRLPAEARLTINDAATQQASGTRTFMSPPLRRGEDYHYTLKAELMRGERTLTATRRVAVRAGEEKEVTLTFPSVAGR